MFCPVCKDEYRPGFTHCATCDVDLVEHLAAVEGKRAPVPPPAVRPGRPVSMTDFCGFVSLDEARQARDHLRAEHIPAEIVIRDAPGAEGDPSVGEEHWLRVDAARFAQVERLLGEPPPPASDEDELACGACGHSIAAEDNACPGCGATFEED